MNDTSTAPDSSASVARPEFANSTYSIERLSLFASAAAMSAVTPCGLPSSSLMTKKIDFSGASTKAMRVARSLRDDLIAAATPVRIVSDQERVGSLLYKGCKGCVDVAFGAGAPNVELQPEGTGRRLQVSRLGLGKGIGRVDEQSYCGRRWDQLAQQFQPLRPKLHVQRGHTRKVATRPVQAGDKSSCHRVGRRHEDDRYRR